MAKLQRFYNHDTRRWDSWSPSKNPEWYPEFEDGNLQHFAGYVRNLAASLHGKVYARVLPDWRERKERGEPQFETEEGRYPVSDEDRRKMEALLAALLGILNEKTVPQRDKPEGFI